MSDPNKDGFVKTETHQSITTIEFFHPQSNSLPGKILEDLAHAIHVAGNNPEIKVIVLRSKGDRVFCSGASFEELSSIKNKEAGKKFFSGFAHVILAMRDCPKFIIGRVQGKCVGGGVGLAAAVDYAIAAEGAEIKLSELAIGLGPFVIGPAVERKIGSSSFAQLAIDATMWRNADWARRKGLYAEVHPSVLEMDESINRLAYTLAHSSATAMHELKKILWKGTENWDQLLIERAAISGELVASEFTRNSIASISKV